MSSAGTSISPKMYCDMSRPSAPAKVVACHTPLEYIATPRRSLSNGALATWSVKSAFAKAGPNRPCALTVTDRLMGGSVYSHS